MAKVIGLGGIFFKSKDPVKLAEWYRKWLKLDVQEWGGCSFLNSEQPETAYSVWSPFPFDTDYFKPSQSNFMINFRVDNLAEALQQVETGGAELHGETEDSEFGKFGWFIDPEGNKIELWEPHK